MSAYALHNGDCLDVLRTLADNSVDSVVTDPPYELGFMGKAWDASGIANSVELWRECLRVLKPGGHVLAFGGSRTYHRMTCAIEDAGFEIRDSIMWIYGSGFPKSMDVSKAIDKAAGVVREVIGRQKHPTAKDRTGDKSPFQANDSHLDGAFDITVAATDAARQWEGWGTALKPAHEPICVARRPFRGTVAANVQQHGTGALNIDACRVAHCGDSRWPANVIHDGLSDEWSRFFYCPKASKRDRDEGCSANTHPTVKPTDLMRYLCRLVTPSGGVVLDPFAGSGSTGKAAVLEGFRFVGIEREPQYVDIARARIEHVSPYLTLT